MILLALSLLSMAGALVAIYLAVVKLVPPNLEEEARRDVTALTLIAGGLIVFALFCVGVLLLRVVAQYLLRRRTSSSTPYINAWEIAGRRRAVPDENELGELVIADESDWPSEEDPTPEDEEPDEDDWR